VYFVYQTRVAQWSNNEARSICFGCNVASKISSASVSRIGELKSDPCNIQPEFYLDVMECDRATAQFILKSVWVEEFQFSLGCVLIFNFRGVYIRTDLVKFNFCPRSRRSFS